MTFQIRLEGHLGPEWADWFGGLSITLEENGETLLAGPVADQAALHGLLRKVRDMGMPLLSVIRVEPGSSSTLETGLAGAPDVKQGRKTECVQTQRPDMSKKMSPIRMVR